MIVKTNSTSPLGQEIRSENRGAARNAAVPESPLRPELTERSFGAGRRIAASP
jgi:hypothetical protein